VRVLLVLVVVIGFALACVQERPVAAPVIDVPPGSDGGASPVAVTPEPVTTDEAPPSGDDPFIGRWQGIGTQDDGSSWPIVVDLFTLRPGVCAHVVYPTVPCTADWVCTGAKRGQIEAREHLQGDSVNRCVDGGTMTIRILRDELDWEWRGSGQTAGGRLHRAR